MDMDTLMKQAREMQEKVTAAQEMLAEMSVKGIAGNGFVIVELDGKYNLRKLTISPELKNNPVDDISALVSAAYTDAKNKVDALINKVMGEATDGMKLPK